MSNLSCLGSVGASRGEARSACSYVACFHADFLMAAYLAAELLTRFPWFCAVELTKSSGLALGSSRPHGPSLLSLPLSSEKLVETLNKEVCNSLIYPGGIFSL